MARTPNGAGFMGPQLTYTCRAVPDAGPLEERLTHALQGLPAGICNPSAESTPDEKADEPLVRAGTAADGAAIKEGSYLVGKAGRLMQIVGGVPEPVAIREGKGGDGIPVKSAKIIRALLPIRDAIRDVLRAQAANTPWAPSPSEAPRRLLGLHPLLRADQPHRHLGDGRRRDGRGARDAPAAKPGAVRRRPGLLARRLDRDLRSGDRAGPQGTVLLRARDRTAGRPGHHQRRRRPRRDLGRNRPRRPCALGRPDRA